MTKQRIAPRFDALSPASKQASAVKRKNRAKGSGAEALLRKRLWARGLRYRLHAKELPGKPDIVFRKLRLAVFVDGDFWHGRDWDQRQRKLAQGHNPGYWVEKIRYNLERDRRNTLELESRGWRVLRLWETDILKDPDGATEAVARLAQARAIQADRRSE
ncbi:very short patch repair endonuclease [Thiorhodococcus minor]|uniref:Very short patch repair endonuclease n=1 Tax=Thiorhodococcus minor TaxID=57489 RepID=A0A6M0K429_9GAMM|nr:very short patch repair endonuclease [Thiorhodococcus minor]NEV64014.1 very short patch repair endonuclease [Thiorhodococcus minor]